jgi:hypothetical protein
LFRKKRASWNKPSHGTAPHSALKIDLLVGTTHHRPPFFHHFAPPTGCTVLTNHQTNPRLLTVVCPSAVGQPPNRRKLWLLPSPTPIQPQWPCLSKGWARVRIRAVREEGVANRFRSTWVFPAVPDAGNRSCDHSPVLPACPSRTGGLLPRHEHAGTVNSTAGRW